MQVTSETVAPRQVVLTIVPDAETIDRAMRQAARELSRIRPLRGYRPGRAPYALVERTFGRETILNEALGKIAPEIYHEAIHEANIQPYQQGTLDIETEDPLVLRVDVPLIPEVKLGAVEELSIEAASDVVVTDEDIDEQLDMLRRQHAEAKVVNRPLMMGDQVTCAILGSVGDEEVQRQENATLDLTEYLEPEGFAEALLGASPDEVREFSLTYPEDEPNEKLAGNKVDYRVAVAEVRELTLPELDDSFAKTVGDFETLDALREHIAEDLRQQRDAQGRASERLRAVDALIAASEIAYPNAAVEREIDRAIANQRARAQRMGFSLDTYLRLTNRTEQDLRDEIRKDAENGLLQRLVLIEYAKQEGILLTDDEGNAALNSYVNNIGASYGEKANEVLQQAVQNGGLTLAIEDALVMKAAQRLADRLAGRPVAEETETAEAGTKAEAESEAESGEAPTEDTETEEAPDATA